MSAMWHGLSEEPPLDPGAARSAAPGRRGPDVDFVERGLARPWIWHIIVGSADNALMCCSVVALEGVVAEGLAEKKDSSKLTGLQKTVHNRRLR